jgi:hypothetical protein
MVLRRSRRIVGIFVIRTRHKIFASNQMTGDKEDRPGYVASMLSGGAENVTISWVNKLPLH